MPEDKNADMQRRIEAELQVEAFLGLLQKHYGLKPEDIPRILDDMRWVREHRAGINRVSWAVALGILALALSGVASALWEGLKHAVRGN